MLHSKQGWNIVKHFLSEDSLFCEFNMYVYTFQYITELYCQNTNKRFGTSVLNPGAGFLRIFTVAFDRLF